MRKDIFPASINICPQSAQVQNSGCNRTFVSALRLSPVIFTASEKSKIFQYITRLYPYLETFSKFILFHCIAERNATLKHCQILSYFKTFPMCTLSCCFAKYTHVSQKYVFSQSVSKAKSFVSQLESSVRHPSWRPVRNE